MTKRDSYKTPGRECAHVKSGCCPKCYDPMGLLRSTREFRQRRNRNRSTTTPPQKKEE